MLLSQSGPDFPLGHIGCVAYGTEDVGGAWQKIMWFPVHCILTVKSIFNEVMQNCRGKESELKNVQAPRKYSYVSIYLYQFPSVTPVTVWL
jgi:hypothetical protein